MQIQGAGRVYLIAGSAWKYLFTDFYWKRSDLQKGCHNWTNRQVSNTISTEWLTQCIQCICLQKCSVQFCNATTKWSKKGQYKIKALDS